MKTEALSALSSAMGLCAALIALSVEIMRMRRDLPELSNSHVSPLQRRRMRWIGLLGA